MTGGKPPAEHLAYETVTVSERRVALGVIGLLAAAALLMLPFGARPGPENAALLPALTAASLVVLFVSALTLYNQYRLTRFIPFAFLSTAYFSTALLMVPYAATFPRLFSPSGFGVTAQTAAWLALCWHAVFALLCGAYVVSEFFYRRRAPLGERSAVVVRAYVQVVVLAALGTAATVLCRHDFLPSLIAHRPGGIPLGILAESALLGGALLAAGALALKTRLRQTNQLWLVVVLAAFALESIVGTWAVHAPYSLAWYADAVATLAWVSLFLIVQLRHANDQLTAFAADKQSLVEETLRDPLTGLYNRRGFNVRYEDAMTDCKLAHAPLALLALDLDFFKPFNDHYGHVAGDEALRKVASSIQQVANRPADACCRVGGEEFAIVLPMTDLSGASAVAERVRATMLRMRIPHAYGGPQAILTVSIGVAVADGAAPLPAKELFERADKALYRAKRMGRNRFANYADFNEPLGSSSSSRRVG